MPPLTNDEKLDELRERVTTLETAATAADRAAYSDLYNEVKRLADDCAALRGKHRDLIGVLQSLYPPETTFRRRLDHLVTLTPNDLHTKPAEPE